MQELHDVQPVENQDNHPAKAGASRVHEGVQKWEKEERVLMLDSNDKIVAFYQEAFKTGGNTPAGMRWGDAHVHHLRLRRTKRLITALGIPIHNVLDVGCGTGMLWEVWNLKTAGIYHGVDLVPEYIEIAQGRLQTYPGAIATCDDFLTWDTVVRFSVTVAIGTFAWQDIENVRKILNRMWELTHEGGAMAFTFIPDNPLSKHEVNRMRYTYDPQEMLVYGGYGGAHDEHLVILKKSKWGLSSYRHQEELEDEVLRGEHRDVD